MNGPAVLLIVVGMTIVIISFFGCCGAIKENYCMMLTVSQQCTCDFSVRCDSQQWCQDSVVARPYGSTIVGMETLQWLRLHLVIYVSTLICCIYLQFSILMMIILVCQVIGSIAGFVYYNKIRSIADEEMKESLKNYHDSEKGGVTAAWDWMQRDVSCNLDQ